MEIAQVQHHVIFFSFNFFLYVFFIDLSTLEENNFPIYPSEAVRF